MFVIAAKILWPIGGGPKGSLDWLQSHLEEHEISLLPRQILSACANMSFYPLKSEGQVTVLLDGQPMVSCFLRWFDFNFKIHKSCVKHWCHQLPAFSHLRLPICLVFALQNISNEGFSTSKNVNKWVWSLRWLLVVTHCQDLCTPEPLCPLQIVLIPLQYHFRHIQRQCFFLGFQWFLLGVLCGFFFFHLTIFFV